MLEDKCYCCQFLVLLCLYVVWFGEMLFGMDEIYMVLLMVDIFIVIGIFGYVYLVVGFVYEVKLYGVYMVELNFELSQVGSEFEEKYYGLVSQVVLEFVDKFLKGLQCCLFGNVLFGLYFMLCLFVGLIGVLVELVFCFQFLIIFFINGVGVVDIVLLFVFVDGLCIWIE